MSLADFTALTNQLCDTYHIARPSDSASGVHLNVDGVAMTLAASDDDDHIIYYAALDDRLADEAERLARALEINLDHLAGSGCCIGFSAVSNQLICVGRIDAIKSMPFETFAIALKACADTTLRVRELLSQSEPLAN